MKPVNLCTVYLFTCIYLPSGLKKKYLDVIELKNPYLLSITCLLPKVLRLKELTALEMDFKKENEEFTFVKR